MKMRWLLVVVLIGLLFVLSPMAFASPPDVILHLTWCCPAVSSVQPSFDAAAVAIVVGLVPDRHEGPIPDPSSFSHDTRAPPAS